MIGPQIVNKLLCTVATTAAAAMACESTKSLRRALKGMTRKHFFKRPVAAEATPVVAVSFGHILCQQRAGSPARFRV